MRYVKCFLLMLVVVFLFTGCTHGNVMGVPLPKKNSEINELITKEYSDRELENIAKFEGTVSDLNVVYSVECIRKSVDGYRVTYCGAQKICVLTFDDNGNKIHDGIYGFSKVKSDFDGIFIGESIEKVKQIDPNGNYDLLYVSLTDAPLFSIHYTTDGYMIKIHYNYSLNVTKIEYELI